MYRKLRYVFESILKLVNVLKCIRKYPKVSKSIEMYSKVSLKLNVSKCIPRFHIFFRSQKLLSNRILNTSVPGTVFLTLRQG